MNRDIVAAQRTMLAMDWDDQRGTRREHQNLQHIGPNEQVVEFERGGS